MRLIAEASINHNGSIERAIDMICAAVDAGADTVKFQMLDPNHYAEDFIYQGWHMRKLLTECAFTMEEWAYIKLHCEEAGIKFLCTPQTVGDFEKLLTLGIDEVKISSDNLRNEALLKKVNESKLPVIISTGMASAEDIDEAERILRFGFVSMCCTSEYPCPSRSVNLNRLHDWGGLFGFSDHTEGSMAAVLALALGATVFEKHFTLDHDLPGPDHSWACNPEELKSYFDDLRTAETMLGSGEFKPTEAELELKKQLGV